MSKTAFHKYKLSKPITDSRNDRECIVEGIQNVTHDPSGMFPHPYIGACCLLRNPKHPGYCNLCAVYLDKKSECHNVAKDGMKWEASPLFNENGERILVKHSHDEILCLISSWIYMNVEAKETWKITFFKNGIADKWEE